MDKPAVDKSLEELIREERQKGSGAKKISKPAHPPRTVSRKPEAKGRGKDAEHGSLPSVQVSNLPAGITMADVRTLFATCGSIARINTYWTPEIGDRFNARVCYNEVEVARKAVEVYHQAKLDGQTLSVRLNEHS